MMRPTAFAVCCIAASFLSLVSCEKDSDPQKAMASMYSQYCTGKDAKVAETATTMAAANKRPMNQCMCGFLRESHELSQASSITGAFTPCVNGQAGGYPCSNVDLMSYMRYDDVNGATVPNGFLNDIWGWYDSAENKEYALVGTASGTSFIDITDPLNPVFKGKMWSAGSSLGSVATSLWRDIKTYQDYAFVVSEAPGHGMQVYDLTGLRVGSTSLGNSERRHETTHYDAFGSAHNIFINEDTGYAYVVGSKTCGGGLHMVDVRVPLNPTFAGCYSGDGYTHDVQCVLYNGPDSDYSEREICFASNVDAVTIVDVTEKSNPKQLSSISYSQVGYTHQGWLTEDREKFLFGDETDEMSSGIPTRTLTLNVESLTNPYVEASHSGQTNAIDHNQYVKGNYVYQANYRAGLVILEINGAQLTEVGSFDIYPSSNAANFNGAWSVYPYLPSGNIIVSGIEQGLFVLKPTVAAIDA